MKWRFDKPKDQDIYLVTVAFDYDCPPLVKFSWYYPEGCEIENEEYGEAGWEIEMRHKGTHVIAWSYQPNPFDPCSLDVTFEGENND